MNMLEFHPLANIFPLIEGKEFDDLVDDIRTHGVREPIWLYDGQIIDGRNRYRASAVAETDCPMREYLGDDPAAFVVSLNLKRRHLNESQRSMVAAKLETLRHGGDRKSDQDANLHLDRETAAKLLNVSTRTVASAKQVQDNAAPELVAAVERGKVSVSAAADVATLPKDEQREIVARGEDEIVKAANRIKREKKEKNRADRKQKVAELAATIEPVADRYALRHEACIGALSLDAGSVDWVITDPPYPKEYLPVYADLAEVAERVLKPGGSLLCMIGQSYLPDIVSMLGDRLTYHWTIAYLMPGGQATQIFPRRINTFWKPVLWFVKGEYAGDWIGDATRSGENDKSQHHWGQSESGMADLMTRFVKPGDVVLDPFMGAATTGVVALDLGASFIGYDSDADAFNSATVRLNRAKLVA